MEQLKKPRKKIEAKGEIDQATDYFEKTTHIMSVAENNEKIKTARTTYATKFFVISSLHYVIFVIALSLVKEKKKE